MGKEGKYIMELSSFTLQVLKNFAAVNSNIVINPGNTIMTMSEAKNVLAKATVPETFPAEVGVYDLNELLNVLSLVDSPRVSFRDNYMMVGDVSGRTTINYYYSDVDMLTHPSKPIDMPEPDVHFTLDQTTLNNLKRAANVLGHSQLVIEPNEGSIKLTIEDQENSTSNNYSIDVDGGYNNDSFSFVLNINNLKMIADDYQVNISSKLISEFKSANSELVYWVALEKSSKYGE